MASKEIKILKEIGEFAQTKKLPLWAVGGFVRDFYLGKKTYDIDICVEGKIDDLLSFCRKKYGAKITRFETFGTARVSLENGLKLDFVRCRKEVYPKPASLPQVAPSKLHDDLFRRDFTANAGALSLLPSEFFKDYDLFEAKKAIKKGYIQILHSKSFIDDPTRIFRAIRFAARFNWKIEKTTLALLKKAVKENYLLLLSRARLNHELVKILEEKKPLAALKMLKKFDILKYYSPTLKVPQNIERVSALTSRLTLLAFNCKEENLLKNLTLPRQIFMQAQEDLKLLKNQKAVNFELSKEQKNLLKLCYPKLKPCALKKCFIDGAWLKAQGLNGEKIGFFLDIAAKNQFKGLYKSKSHAQKEILKLIKK
ncbi:MAG: CCA tRNA nucleotidyltransferase [Elusimicrobiaceae bacterium]|nr:CCA tRNA nucleotidyltransferase [Elusimicrobiaceae bacterium]